MTRNMLEQEASPYLRQHKDNPVHWHGWRDETFAIARQENKPVLLSVGYAACHWCHVMAHESFESQAVADLMNELFINIKVDREERPDIDSIYQNALALTGQQGGWPLTMFLTPNGEPFWGGTYFPPEPRFGRPGFPEVLEAVAKIYRDDPGKVTQNAGALVEGLHRLAAQSGVGPARIRTVDQLDAVAATIFENVDMTHGGSHGAPKFPQTTHFTLLWRGYLRTGNTDWRDAVILTLDHMCQGGIYDHLGGGFARYSTDAAWLAPHFEKMLYDNAQLLELLTLVWAETKSPLYEQRVRETVAWLFREMRIEDGFAGTLDADSERREGAFYVWDEAEIDELLGRDSAGFKTTYDVVLGGNWEGTTILNRLHSLAWAGDAAEAALMTQRKILWEAREPRERPALDDKVLTDWNAMMMVALAQAGAVFDQPEWIASAIAAFDFIDTKLRRDGKLYHSWREGQLNGRAVLDDHAQFGRAAVTLFSVTGDERFLAAAEMVAEKVETLFLDETGGGYYFTPSDAEQLIARTRTAMDNATPAGNGVMAEVLARLYHLTGKDQYRLRVDGIVKAFTGVPPEQFAHLATTGNAFELLANATQIAVIAEPGSDAANALISAAFKAGDPNLVVRCVPPGAELPAGHPALGKTQRDGQPTAYVCHGTVCGAPVTDASALTDAMVKV